MSFRRASSQLDIICVLDRELPIELQQSIEQFQKVVGVTSASEVMQLVLVTQYFDTLKAIGEGDKTNTLFLSHSPQTVGDVSRQITEAMLVAQRADRT